MDGVLHVIEQLGAAHKQALAVIAAQSNQIALLEAALAALQEPKAK